MTPTPSLRTGLLLLCIFRLPLVAGAQLDPASPLAADAIVARVNGKPILLSDLREAALDLQIPVASLRSEGINGEGFRKAVTLLVDEELLVQEAAKAEVKLDETELSRRVDALIRSLVVRMGGEAEFAEFLKRSHLNLETLRSSMLQRERRRDLATAVVGQRVRLNGAEIDEFRRKREEAGEASEEVLLAHILIRCLPGERDQPAGRKRLEKALEIAKQAGVDRGGFRKLAVEVSEDAASRERGGVLGWVNPKSLAGPLADRISTMAEGDVSEPVASDQGWHILHLMERHAARDLLFAERFEAERLDLLESLRKNAVIEIYPLN